MKIKLVFSLFWLLGFGISAQILACSCLANIQTCQRFGFSDAIFVGTAVGVKNEGVKEFTTFEIKETIAGANAKTLVVQNREGSSCDIVFEQGETYLIFASGDAKKGYSSYLCSGNLRLSEAQDLLIELKNLPPPGSGGKIYGNVSEALKKRREESVPMPGVDMTIREIGGRRKVYKAVTDGKGDYQIIVPPGKYKVVPTIPVYADLNLYSEDPVTVKDQSCEDKSFTVSNDAQVSGKIIDADGKPVPEIRVELIAVGENPEPFDGEAGYSDEKGEFIIYSVPAGRYTLSVNFNVAPDLERPFPTTFYPFASEREKAKVFEIGLGQSINNLIFRLPPRIKAQKITGKVVFPDGTPAAGMTVNLQENDSDSSFSYTQTDENGNFTVEGFSGDRYNFGVTYYGDDREKENYFVKKSVFTLTPSTVPFRLVLEKKP
jgi:hypothetical protein